MANPRVYKFLTEILDDIQEDEANVQKYLTNTSLKAVFQFTYNPEKKWLLPDSDPPYRPAPEPLGMTPTNLLTTIRTWPNFSRTDLSKEKREQLFITLLEGVHDSEAILILSIKNGNLRQLYPFATQQFAVKHGFIAADPTQEVTITSTGSGYVGPESVTPTPTVPQTVEATVVDGEVTSISMSTVSMVTEGGEPINEAEALKEGDQNDNQRRPRRKRDENGNLIGEAPKRRRKPLNPKETSPGTVAPEVPSVPTVKL